MSLGKMFIVSGPAGVGKSTVCSQLIKMHSNSLRKIVTATTRLPRPGEIDGVDYCFLDEATFLRYIAEDKFLEYANVHKKYYYGTPIDQVMSNIRHGINSLLIVDVQGMLAIRKRFSFMQENIVSIFITPESAQVLESRLKYRATESVDERNRRIRSAENEMRFAKYYDYIVVSGTKCEDLISMEMVYNLESVKRTSTYRKPSTHIQRSYAFR